MDGNASAMSQADPYADLFQTPGAMPAPGTPVAHATAPVGLEPPPGPAPGPAPAVATKENPYGDLFQKAPGPAAAAPSPDGAPQGPAAPDPNWTTGTLAKQTGWGAIEGTTSIPEMLEMATPMGLANQLEDKVRKIYGEEPRQTVGGLLNKGLGFFGYNPDAEENQPKNRAERLARGVGSMLPMALAPELAPEKLLAMGTAKGLAAGAKGILTATGKGAASGLGAAGAQEFAPDSLKPIAGLIGGLAGGLAAETPGMLGRGARAVIPPVTTKGTNLAAGSELLKGASDPAKIAADTQPLADKQILKGSPGTLGQVLDDQGLRGQETSFDEKQTAKLQAIKDQQAAARVEAMPKPGGNSTALADQFAARLARIDADNEAAVAAAKTASERATADSDLGGLRPRQVGDKLRSPLEETTADEKARAKQLYDAVDPDNNLHVVTSAIQEAHDANYVNVTDAKKIGITPQETAVGKIINSWGPAVSFREMADTRSVVTALMRETKVGTLDYARLVGLRNGFDETIQRTLQHVDAEEARAVAAGKLDPANTVQARFRDVESAPDLPGRAEGVGNRAVGEGPAGATVVPQGGAPGAQETGGGFRPGQGPAGPDVEGAKNPVQPKPVSDTGSVYWGDKGAKADVRYELAELGGLNVSHDMDFRKNPAFPERFQPRDRSTDEAQTQVVQMAAGLNPDQMGRSADLSTGAPIISHGPENHVIAGNGRTMALERRYAGHDKGAAYKQWLADQGYDVSGMQRPVLVRRLAAPMADEGMETLARASNDPVALARSAVERSRTDAKNLTGDVLELAKPGKIDGAANREFVAALLKKYPGNDRASMTEGARLSRDGVTRIQAALTRKAYGDDALIRQAFEATDPTVKDLANGLVDAAPVYAKLRQAIEDGEISKDHDISGALITDVHAIMAAREAGFPATHVLAQTSMFPMDDAARGLLFGKTDGGKPRLFGGKRISDEISTYVEKAMKNTAGPRLIGEATPAEQILRQSTEANAKTLGEDTSVVPGAEGEAAAVPAPTLQAQGPNVVPMLSKAAKAKALALETRAKLQAEVGARGGQKPPMPPVSPATPGGPAEPGGPPPAMLGRSDAAAAKAADVNYRGFKERERPIKPLLERAPYATSPFKITNDVLPSKVWKRGPAGADAINHYLTYTGNSPKAIHALTDAATLSLQERMVGNELTPAALERWSAQHGQAIDALERVAPGFTDRFKTAARAKQAVTDVETANKIRSDTFKTSAAAKLLGLSDPADIAKKVGAMLKGQGGVKAMSELVTEAGHDPTGAAMAGLRQAVADHLATQLQSASEEIGSSGQMALKVKAVQAYLRDNQAALSKVLTPDEMNNLRAITEDIERSSRSGIKGAAKEQQPAGLGRAIMNLGNRELGKLIFKGLGAVGGGVLGAGFGPFGAAMGSAMGIGLEALREAGFSRVQQVKREMILNPEFGRTWMKAAAAKQAGIIPFKQRLLRSLMIGATVHNPGKREDKRALAH